MTWPETYISWQPRVLSVLRIMTGLLFLQYGMAKLLKFPAVLAFKDVALFSLYGLAGTLELVGGALMILGLFTRPIAFILAGEMAFAYFLEHAPRGFLPILNGGNLAILLCFVFFYLSFAGAGPWSLDALRRPQRCARHRADDAGAALPASACEDATQPETADAADPPQTAAVEGHRY